MDDLPIPIKTFDKNTGIIFKRLIKCGFKYMGERSGYQVYCNNKAEILYDSKTDRVVGSSLCSKIEGCEDG